MALLLLSVGVGFSRRAGSSSRRPEGRHAGAAAAGAVAEAGPEGVAGRAREAATRADRTRQTLQVREESVS